MKIISVNKLISISCALGLASCASGPEGKGGIAELQYASMYSVETNQELEPTHGLRFDASRLKNSLDILVLKGAYYCFPASTNEARLRQNRIRRQIEGGLDFDAANDIIIQRQVLYRLDRQLDYVTSQAKCIWPSNSHLEDYYMLVDLLNSDNQFAFDDENINPKFVIKLQRAAKILKFRDTFSLEISGHTDMKGSEEYNHTLAENRARKVKDFLVLRGVAPNRLEIVSLGKLQPDFIGEEPHIRLVNRRVEIRVIDASRF